MRRIHLVLALLCVTMFAWSQRTPLHPLDIKIGSTDLYEILDAWEPGTPPPGTDEFDDQFYISRVRPLERIVDGDYQVNSTVDKNRKLMLWLPMDDPSATWKALPRYSFEGDNFSMWSYTDIHGNWSAPWMRATAGLADVAHKNGVKIGVVNGIPWAASVAATIFNQHGKVFYRLFTKNSDGTYKYTEKLVKLMKYYGIDGLGVNSEFNTTTDFMNNLIAFVRDCKIKAKAIDWEFQLHWYDGTNDNGGITFDRGLAAHNDGIFGNGTAPVTDAMFFNYNWYNATLNNSATYALSIDRSSYDLYAGFDIQGRALRNSGWRDLQDSKISVGFWGAHSQSLIHQSATDDGASDVAIQKAYLMKQELIFSGGNRNPGLTPGIRTDATLANADLKTFHGLASLITAKSTLQHIPFVTRFSLGNGLFFNDEGKTTFDHKWHNINTQDFLPTWRWWITDRNDQVTQAGLNGLIKADFTFDDAWFGGSCLKIHGSTDFSRVKLFKTKLNIQPEYTLSLTYKVLKGTDPKAKLFVAKQGALTTYLEVALPAAAAEGEWTTKTFTLSELGLAANDVVSMIGISFENTDAEYGLLLGELAVRNPAQTFNTVTPEIIKLDVLRRRYNQVDFKVYYKSKDETNGVKTYNDEVGTWYFEIFLQQKDQPEQLITATTSWAGYVIDGPLVPKGSTEARVGVRAVSPDGLHKSPIAWTEYKEVPYDTPLDDVIIDKPVVKPNETFTVKYLDELHVPAQKWEIKDPITGTVIVMAENAIEVSTKIDKIGLYDLHVTDNKGNLVITRGFVQITPEETGAVPSILSFTSDKQEAATNEEVRYTYTSKDGAGKVSRAVKVKDPEMLTLPAVVGSQANFTLAFWFKSDGWGHDKYGTNLINKRDFKANWPHNNWGNFWVHVWPEGVYNGLNANVVSLTQWNNTNVGYNGNPHESPNQNCMANDFSVPANVWTHIAIAIADNKQELWLNGKKVASQSVQFRGNNTSGNAGASPINLYIGGANVYHAGFVGAVDDVQYWTKVLVDTEIADAMKGYYGREIPQGLTGYWDFEDAPINGTTFKSKGNQTTLNASIAQIVDGGGENTTGASLKLMKADNSLLGYPGIVGSLDITTTPEWKLPNAEITDNTVEKEVKVVYKSSGTFDAGLDLVNMWGKATENKVDYIVINSKTSVKTQNELKMSLYPNPFVESVNLKFTEAGNYTVRVLNNAGQIVKNSNLTVNNTSDIINVSVDGAQGVYVLQVLKGNELYRSVKLIKN